jgi:hypothetical protein
MVISSAAIVHSFPILTKDQRSIEILVNMVLETTPEFLARPVILFPLGFVLLSVLYSLATSNDRLPETIPWIGKDCTKLFAETRAHFSSFSNVRQWLQAGYGKVRSRAQTVIFRLIL